MSVLPILELPDPRLRLASRPVDTFDSELAVLVDNLLDTMYATSGIGMSAPQVDDRRRVLVMDLSGDRSAPGVYINPEIVAADSPGIVEESCLSVPGVVANVIRMTRVRVRAQDPEGETLERDLDGMSAVCLQHEMDHLDGKLLIDRLSLLGRLRARAALRKHRKAAESAAR